MHTKTYFSKYELRWEFFDYPVRAERDLWSHAWPATRSHVDCSNKESGKLLKAKWILLQFRLQLLQQLPPSRCVTSCVNTDSGEIVWNVAPTHVRGYGLLLIQTSYTAYLLRARRAAESSRRATQPPEDPCPRWSILTARSSAHAGWSITAIDPCTSSEPRTPLRLTESIAHSCHCYVGKTGGET